jgi:hypothetical protein
MVWARKCVGGGGGGIPLDIPRAQEPRAQIIRGLGIALEVALPPSPLSVFILCDRFAPATAT